MRLVVHATHVLVTTYLLTQVWLSEDRSYPLSGKTIVIPKWTKVTIQNGPHSTKVWINYDQSARLPNGHNLNTGHRHIK
jgi:hypothetical protein